MTLLEKEGEVTEIRTYHWEGLFVSKFRLSLLFPMQEKFVKISACPPTVFPRGRFLRRAWNKEYREEENQPGWERVEGRVGKGAYPSLLIT